MAVGRHRCHGELAAGEIDTNEIAQLPAQRQQNRRPAPSLILLPNLLHPPLFQKTLDCAVHRRAAQAGLLGKLVLRNRAVAANRLQHLPINAVGIHLERTKNVRQIYGIKGLEPNMAGSSAVCKKKMLN